MSDDTPSPLNNVITIDDVVGAFPDGQSALNLAARRLRHIAGTAWSTKRYLNIELPKDQMRGAITA
jgi:putative transposase